MDVLPADRHLAYLVTSDPQDRDNTYINSVFVDVRFCIDLYCLNWNLIAGFNFMVFFCCLVTEQVASNNFCYHI